MTRRSFKILLIFILSLTTYYANAQGCSDAGFCTINSIKPNSSDTVTESTNQVKVGVSLGSADNSISIFGNYIEYNRQVTNSFGIDAKITSLSQSGNGISNFGISDIYLTGNYKVNEKLKLILGTKIPFDLIFGAGYEIKKIQLVLAYQQPMSQNKNEFIAENYPVNSKIREFQTTNKFKRSSDVLLRVSYPVKLGEKFRITSSLLPIYHLSNDKYTNNLGIENEIKGSQGLTLNGNAYLDYEINNKNALQLNVGMPFVVRDARPDGLTRSFVVNLEYKVKF